MRLDLDSTDMEGSESPLGTQAFFNFTTFQSQSKENTERVISNKKKSLEGNKTVKMAPLTA